jgi:hypothetical protein
MDGISPNHFAPRPSEFKRTGLLQRRLAVVEYKRSENAALSVRAWTADKPATKQPSTNGVYGKLHRRETAVTAVLDRQQTGVTVTSHRRPTVKSARR